MDGVRWAKIRNFAGGEKTDAARERLPELYFESALNFDVRSVDGVLVRRAGRSRINTGTFSGGFPISGLNEYIPNDASEPKLVAVSDQSTVGVLAPLVSTAIQTLKANMAAGSRPDTQQVDQFLYVTNRDDDPCVWNGGATNAYPSNNVYDASIPPCVFVLDRNDRGVVATTDDQKIFNPGDVVWYCFAWENTDGLVGGVPTDMPGCALRVNYLATKASKGYLSLVLPLYPGFTRSDTKQNIQRLRVYRTLTQNVGSTITPPKSLAEFHYVATTIGGGIWSDTFTDDEIAGNESPTPFQGFLPRAGWAAVHYGRLILGDLRTPRALIYFASSSLLGGDFPRLSMSVAGSSPGTVILTIKVDHTGADTGPPYAGNPPVASTLWGANVGLSVTVGQGTAPPGVSGLKLRDVVNAFNAYCDRVVSPSADHGQLAGDPVAWSRMVLVGDPNTPMIPATATATSALGNLGGAITNERIDAGTDAQHRILRTITGDAPLTYLDFRGSLQIGDIVNPLRPRPDLAIIVARSQGDNLQGEAKYKNPAGAIEMLIGTRSALYKIVGQGIEVGGEPDFALVEVSTKVGFWCRNAIAESPDGVYFVSYRGVEFFDGYRVDTVPISNDLTVAMAYALSHEPQNVFMHWFDNRLFVSMPMSANTSTRQLFIYDERLALRLRDRSAGWIVHSGNFGGLTTWHRSASASQPAQLVGGSFYQGVGVDTSGSVYRFDDTQAPGDSDNTGAWTDITVQLVTRTIMPGDGRRVRLRALRPFFKKPISGFTLSVALDDRAFDDGSAPIALPAGAAGDDLEQPLLRLGLARNPRCRRVRVRLDCSELAYQTIDPFEFRGIDIGYVDERGAGEVGATH